MKDDRERKTGPRTQPLTAAAGVLLLVVLFLAACGPVASTPVPDAPPTAAVQATPAPTLEPSATPADADAPEAVSPSVDVSDQAVVDGSVTIAEVVSAGPGWLVIHADRDGSPGQVLGYSPVADGDNRDVSVDIDVAQASERLYAMLHEDAGEVGTYEFPGADGPVQGAAEMVNPAFSITGGLPEADPTATVAPTAEPTAMPTSAPTAEPTASGSMDEGEVELEDFQFVPQVLTVKAGTRVKFANKDEVTHTVTSDTGAFDSGGMGKGDEFYFTFTEPGEYLYYCAPHGGPGGAGMSGKIIVVP